MFLPELESQRKQAVALATLIAQTRYPEAIVLARELAQRFPEDGLNWKRLGALLWWQSAYADAFAPMQTAARLLPKDAEAQINFGNALLRREQYDDAIRSFQAAADIAPRSAAAHYHLGMTCLLAQRFAEAKSSLETAVALRPAYLTENGHATHSDLLQLYGYDPQMAADTLFAEHRKFGTSVEAPFITSWPRHTNSRDPDRVLRVGFVSGDLLDHSVGMFLEPIVSRLAQSSSLMLHAYSNRDVEDEVTARLRGHVGAWFSIAGRADDDVVRRIAADGIDVLIDLSGHTALNRLPVFARKPAPLQMSWLGYPGTTGLQAMDYYFADDCWLPEPRFARLFTEKLVYLPDRWAFAPHPQCPAVGPLPAVRAGHLTFGSFHRPGKINAFTIRLWADLLHALPDSRLILAGIAAGAAGAALREAFAAHGIAPQRLHWHGRYEMDGYLALHNEIDLCLDTQPYAGATTTMHSLSMGVPTLTIAGETPAAHACAGILRHLGLEDFIAADASDFVAKGVAWAGNRSALAALRTGLRSRLAASPGGRPDLIAAHFESALRHLWRRWCAGFAAESFHSKAASYELGMLHLERQQPVKALPHLAAALNASPETTAYWLGYLEALLQVGQLDAARELLTLAGQQGVTGDAIEELTRRLDAAAGDALLALVAQRRFAEALAMARALTERQPNHGLGWKIRGALLWAEGFPDAALAAMFESVKLLPKDPETFSNLGMSLAKLKRYAEAESYLRQALAVEPRFAGAYYRLGMTYELQGRYAEAEAALRSAIALRAESPSVDDEQGYSNLLYLLGYNADVGPDALFAESCRFAEIFETPWRGAWRQHSNSRDPERRLRVGFVSGDLRDHSVATFLEPVLPHFALSDGLELHAYHNHTAEDPVTARLRGHFDAWHPIAALTDDELEHRIAADGIDILIDLSGHTALNRLRAFARKLAPVQISWLGFPATTGLTAIDYYLADAEWLPPGQFDRLFTEKLVYLPDRWAFAPHAAAPAVGPLPALETGRLTFGSFHRLGKINSASIDLWSRLLRALPDSALLFVGVPVDESQSMLRERFGAQGVHPDRLRFHDRCPMDRYLGFHHQVDIGLDTHPYCGATTSMHSLSMGVPTLTLAGATSTARACAGILRHVGLDSFIAADAAGFVAHGLYWAEHLGDLADLRGGLRARLMHAPGGRPQLIAAHLEAALRQAWRRWCAGLPAESFHSSALREVA